MRQKREAVHYGQIPTNPRTIKAELFKQGVRAIHTLGFHG